MKINMAAVLTSSTDDEQPAVVRCLWAQGKGQTEIHKEMQLVYGLDTLGLCAVG